MVLQKQKDKFLFGFLLCSVVLLLEIHSIVFLGMLGVFFIVLEYQTAIKAFFAIFAFNASISIGMVIASFFSDIALYPYLALFNLRVFDITFLTLYITTKINLLRVFSSFETIRFLLLATLLQIQSYKKTYEDFKLALYSRTIKKLSSHLQKEFIASMFYFFLKKSLYHSKERTQALKARGFFD